jgi:hypothetical protein
MEPTNAAVDGSWRGGVPVRFLGPSPKEDKRNRGRGNGLCVLPTHTDTQWEEKKSEKEKEKPVLAGRRRRERMRGEVERERGREQGGSALISSYGHMSPWPWPDGPHGSRTHGQEKCSWRLLPVNPWMMFFFFGMMWMMGWCRGVGKVAAVSFY